MVGFVPPFSVGQSELVTLMSLPGIDPARPPARRRAALPRGWTPHEDILAFLSEWMLLCGWLLVEPYIIPQASGM